ncbi:hypothetical protein JXL19_08150 [bacterium]|nr:hypothetical protein [bacterium]
MKSYVIIFLVFGLIAGCASGGFDSAMKTSQLRQGMSYQEVVQLLGEPKTSEMKKGAFVATFWLHEMWKGNVPYDLVFEPKKRTLESWSENKDKYEENQNFLSQLAGSLSQGSQETQGTQGAQGSQGNQGSQGATPAGPNDSNLQKQIAGVWWGYSGSTERKIGLCPDGSYMDYTESGYSGKSTNQYGDTTMAWGTANQGSRSGRWTITGTTQSGTIYVNFSNGGSTTIQYRQINDPGCLSFNGNTLCRQSAACQ